MGLRRRDLCGGLIGLGVTAGFPGILRSQQLFSAYPFRLGVAAGEPATDGFVIWTRLAPDPLAQHGGMPMLPVPVAVDWEVASDDRFRTIVAKGTAPAHAELGHAVHVEVGGLSPARPYWYRFRVGAERSTTGRARTLPAPGAQTDRIKLGVAGCQHYEDGWFTAYRHLAAEDLDFVFHYGDYIYEGRSNPPPGDRTFKPRPIVRTHEGQLLYSLDDYRRRYAQYKLDPDLQAAHAAAAWFPTFDDHELENNWVGLTDQNGTDPALFALRRAAAFQAYYEHMPFRRGALPGSGGMQIYRRAVIGNLIDLHLLDTRQFRTDQPCGDDFKPVCKGVAAPRAQVLGSVQEAALDRALAERAARWNAIAQQVMMMPLDRRTGDETAPIRNMDSWAGYDAPRERLLQRLKGAGSAIVLTGDEHQNFAGELRTDGGRGSAAAIEFVGTSISSGGDGAPRRSGSDRILTENPFLKWSNDRRGYMVCDVTPGVWSTRYRTVDAVTVPDRPVATAATATVEFGVPTITISA